MNNSIVFDPAQVEAIEKLQQIEQTLLKKPSGGKKKWWKRAESTSPQQGLYLWGGVGRGKTMIMDRFYSQLEIKKKQRFHFHRFMQLVHRQRAELKQVTDPIAKVADEFADQADLLCLDEMHINDITDAMIMGRLLECLFERGVVLITTSNVPPDDLYKNGLQRSRFLPAIALMNQHTEVFNLDSGIDYRLQHLANTTIYHWPHDEQAETLLSETFAVGSEMEEVKQTPVRINGRDIDVLKRANGIVWFEFAELCETSRATNDYIEIARYFHTVIVERLPQLDDESNDPARRFISMIDEFYDRRVKVIISATVGVADLYTGKRLSFEFERTMSRLHEMQSEDYLSSAHIP